MQRGEDKYFTGSEIGVSHMLENEPVRRRVEGELCILWIHCKQHQLTTQQLRGTQRWKWAPGAEGVHCFRDNIP